MKLHAIISETFGVEESEVSDELVFFELDSWDSMAHMMFITNLEESYEIDFVGDDIVNVSTVSELIDLLKSYKVKDL